ncbi:MAG TPA: sodium:proton antiporter [Candidatus Dormibacteraeota bacterium]|nr:sodium:proton antiporter [Candidatus Dormibacteraeota bacterium]
MFDHWWPSPLLGAASGLDPHPALMLPFVLLLVCIAAMPFLQKEWWESHYAKVATVLGAVPVLYYAAALHAPGRLLQVAHEYVSFIALIGSLYVVSGSIHIRVRGEAKPWVNCVYLLAGALLANVIGTTGASMLLIRPWLRMNKYRITSYHVVFFIFIVSNIGGCLTPIGDPPLFLGYLHGVPFWWVMEQGWAAWAMALTGLLAVFWVLDRRNFGRASQLVRDRETAHETWSFDGLRNLAALGLILAAVFLRRPPGLSEGLMVAAALGAYFTTPPRIHQANDFSFGPVREVAWLFAGIFATMMPALDYLESHSAQVGLDSSMKLFWLTGSLSSVLDNAPAYLTFWAAAMGRHGLSVQSRADVQMFLSQQEHELLAISLGAVFFGAVTYIGNGPNFMVKSIASQAKVKTPTFFGYVLRYALPVLMPLFAIVSILFFSRWRPF